MPNVKRQSKRPTAAHFTRYLTIRQALIRRQKTMRSVAQRCGVGQATVTLVAQSRRMSMRVRKALSKATGIKHTKLWG